MSSPIWPGSSPKHSGEMNGHEGLILHMLLEHMQVSVIKLDRIEQSLITRDQRLQKHEELLTSHAAKLTSLEASGLTISKTFSKTLLPFLRQVATPGQWATGLVIMYASLKGILAPEEMKQVLMHFLGLPLK